VTWTAGNADPVAPALGPGPLAWVHPGSSRERLGLQVLNAYLQAAIARVRGTWRS